MPHPDHSPVHRAATAWQRLRPESLPGAFYAFDEKEGYSERVVTYALEKGKLEALYRHVEQAVAEEKQEVLVTVHLGINGDYLTEQLPTYPAFTLFVQLAIKGEERYTNCAELSWEANGRFSSIDPVDVYSGRYAIPAASAYLFVRSWQELSEIELARPFTATSRVLGQRVRSYTFAAAESRQIVRDIGASLRGDKPGIAIHLGSGVAVWEHPFSFRPVVEVRGAVPSTEEAVAGGRRVTGLTNGQGDSFYDYSIPQPPYADGST